MKAQGSTEYLILLSVALVVATVAVALLGFFPALSSDASLEQSQVYWSSAARPFQVIEASSSVDSLCGVDSATGYVLVLQNSEPDPLTINSISVDGSSGFCAIGGAANASALMGPGEQKSFAVITSSFDSPCIEGQIAQMGINISFSSAFIPNKFQSGSKKLMLRCSTSNSAGGNITNSSEYRIHTFKSSGTFKPNRAMTVEVLVVAGGGSGGGSTGGGGGGGGVIYNAAYAVSGPVTVTVGNGGAGGQNQASGINGENSVFGSLVAIGGGGGGFSRSGGANGPGLSGGSGGGGQNYSGQTAGGAGTAGQGNSGGTGASASCSSGGGGGGGAGAPGNSGTATGGAGVQYNISGTATYYGGGGGGGTSSCNFAGGLGGGGTGRATAGDAGSPNTGGGGGGGWYYANGQSGAGGSGIVIVRYR